MLVAQPTHAVGSTMVDRLINTALMAGDTSTGSYDSISG